MLTIDADRRIQLLAKDYFDVRDLVSTLASTPGLWNRHRSRLAAYGPHAQLSDIWVRYSDTPELPGPHESHWYPVAAELPGIYSICSECLRLVEGERLGGVLITKIPAGAECKPHHDAGWHAEYYNLKIAVQLKGNLQQAFHFETESLSALPGDVYAFQNQYTHWVTNPSDEDRLTLILAIKKDER